MCATTGTTPSGTPPGSPPGGSSGGTGLCCDCPAEDDFTTDGNGTYYSSPMDDPSWPLNNKAHIKIERSGKSGTVTVTKTFELSYTNGAETDEAGNGAKVKSAITTAFGTWESKAGSYKIQVEQPGCPKQKLKIKFKSSEVASAPDIAIDDDGTADDHADPLRSYVEEGTAMTFYVTAGDIEWTMIHELGHTLGLPDEYSYDRPTNTAPVLTYKGASDPDESVTLSASAIPPDDPAQFAFDNTTVMGQDSDTTHPKYLYYWIAIEVDRILRSEGVIAVVKVV